MIFLAIAISFVAILSQVVKACKYDMPNIIMSIQFAEPNVLSSLQTSEFIFLLYSDCDYITSADLVQADSMYLCESAVI